VIAKRRQAQIVTVAVLLAAFGVVIARKRDWKAPEMPTASVLSERREPSPQDAVYAMLDAARDGSVSKYLDCYTGQMLASLKQSVAESTEQKFAAYLKQSNAEIKGVALMEPQTLTDRDVKLRIEYVFADRNEVQTLYLEKAGGGWKIARVEAAERAKTLIPYGTPVQ
jgi:hypothetical protein